MSMMFLWKNFILSSCLNFIRNFFYCCKNKKLKIYSGVKIKSVIFSEYNTLYSNVTISNSQIGRFSYIANNTKINHTSIGSFCSIGPNCQIGVGIHPSSIFVSTSPVFYSTLHQCNISFVKKNFFQETKKIIIGNDVWIGTNTIILDGVHIGDGAIVGANSVVTKDIPDYAIVVGSPARIIKYRFSEKNISIIKNSFWWEWDIEELKKNTLSFHNIDIFKKNIDNQSNHFHFKTRTDK